MAQWVPQTIAVSLNLFEPSARKHPMCSLLGQVLRSPKSSMPQVHFYLILLILFSWLSPKQGYQLEPVSCCRVHGSLGTWLGKHSNIGSSTDPVPLEVQVCLVLLMICLPPSSSLRLIGMENPEDKKEDLQFCWEVGRNDVFSTAQLCTTWRQLVGRSCTIVLRGHKSPFLVIHPSWYSNGNNTGQTIGPIAS